MRLARSFRLALLLFLSSVTAGKASAQDPFVAELRSAVPDSARTQVLVLGSVHLPTIRTPFDRAALEPVLDAVARFAPDAVVVETPPPDAIERLALLAEMEPDGPAARVVQAHGSLGATYGRLAQAELGRTRRAAEAEADSLFDAGPPDAHARRRLALLLLAAHDAPSALLHWVQVPDSLRGETDPEKVAARYPDWSVADALNFVAASNQEMVLVGVEAARRAGLDRVYGFNSELETETEARTGYVPRLMEEVEGNPAFEAAMTSGTVEDVRTRTEAAAASGDLLELYLYTNSDEYHRPVAELEQVWLRTRVPSGLDRARWALWEARNLEMGARLRAVTAFQPGGRVLAIVGASHKPYLEVLLRTLADVEVVEFSDFAPADAQ